MASAFLNFIRGLATKKGGNEVVNVFRKNLEDTFGKDEVKEGIRIMTQSERNPEVSKLFFRENESLEDALVDLLEARYMSSERLMTHPLHFNRRGAGAAKRYLQLNDSGKRLTDLPGGPGDKSIYGKFYGDMAKTKIDGKRVYKNERPTIFDEDTLKDTGKTLEGTAESVDELTEFATEIPMVKTIMNQTGKTEKEVREAIVDMANEAYLPGSPKLMSTQDDALIRSYTEVRSYPAEISDFTDEVFDRLDVPRNGPAVSMPPPSPGMKKILQEEGFIDPLDTGDDVVRNMRKMESEIRALKEITEAEQAQYGQGMAAFNRMMDAGEFEDPTDALEFLKNIYKDRTKQAEGGRIGLAEGGDADKEEPIVDLAIPMTTEEILEKRRQAFKAMNYYDPDYTDFDSPEFQEALEFQETFQKPSYAQPFYELDDDRNKSYPLGTELADIMQKGLPPVPGLELTQDVDKVIKQDMLDYEQAYQQATGQEFPDIYDRVVKRRPDDYGPSIMGGYLDDIYFDDGEQFGNEIGINYNDFQDGYASGEDSMGELIMHEFGHALLGDEKDNFGYKIAPEGEYSPKSRDAEELERQIYDIQKEMDDKGAYDNPGEERMVRRFTDILTDMIGKREGEDEEALDRMLAKGDTEYSNRIYGYGEADFEQGLQDMIDAGLMPTEEFQKEFNPPKKTNLARPTAAPRTDFGLGGAATGIMQAIKLAAKGIKPFGQKQTYKQNVTMKGVSPDQFDEIYQKQLARVPDEVYDEPTGKGLYTSLLEAEAIMTGQKLGLLTQPQRSQIAKAMTDKVRKQIYDNPVAGMSNDYLEYMDDAVGRMDDIFEIERLGGDLTPKPIFDGKEMIGAQIDFTQLNKLTEQPKIDRFPNFPAGTSGDNVIPFKPREKKFSGGIAGLLRRIVGPRLEKEMAKPKGPFSTGHRSDHIGDMEQIKNVSRSTADLDDFADMEQMIMDSPRYNEASRGAMMNLIDYEKYRALLLDDNYKLQKMFDVDPEGAENFIRMLYKAEGSKATDFATGGIVGTLANIPQQKSPYQQSIMDARNAMTNEDFFRAQDPTSIEYGVRQQADQIRQGFQQRQSEFEAQRGQIMSAPQQQMGQLPINQERAEFLQTPSGQGFAHLDGAINNLGQALGRGQQQIQEQMAQMNSGQGPISSLQSQNVLNLGGLGNLFGTRS